MQPRTIHLDSPEVHNAIRDLLTTRDLEREGRASTEDLLDAIARLEHVTCEEGDIEGSA